MGSINTGKKTHLFYWKIWLHSSQPKEAIYNTIVNVWIIIHNRKRSPTKNSPKKVTCMTACDSLRFKGKPNVYNNEKMWECFSFLWIVTLCNHLNVYSRQCFGQRMGLGFKFPAGICSDGAAAMRSILKSFLRFGSCLSISILLWKMSALYIMHLLML